MNKIDILFADWDEALIWSALQGYMGNIISNNDKNPDSAMIDIGDFCFFAGKPDPNLFNSINGSKLLIPRDKYWETLIENYYGERVSKTLRYAIKKEPNVFNKEKLATYIKTIDNSFEIRLFEQEIFEMARSEAWSTDLCSQFKNYLDYKEKAVGAVILHQGKLVSGASTYAVYNSGIEIEIDTKPEYRRKGLATVCGAKLILECLERKIYPSWDAHDLRSVALAEKLGYHLDSAYVTYELFAI
ncbi:GNAT family N-acetyltransferase [Anaerosacchariphilus polymeriproducens]|uniref:GNAT family N-acetyltransferase n=1 Tax=Anaerosacchariphilus polymeriproducens TaxID=1812858 RepID=A0A371AUI4_9FIRM|nr:GNAT family N-acetyltransferase [Anaerosacchariphilus polymeriproducens]RDU23202.1 GNAT family N-acetyltransferase [Anaerosacchariphilus polymeriproducens]